LRAGRGAGNLGAFVRPLSNDEDIPVSEPQDWYPTADEVDAWCAQVLSRAQNAALTARLLDDEPYDFRLGVRHTGGRYVEWTSEALGRFHGFWQPCPSRRGPVLLHVPGYGAEMSAHPELVADGYNVLHISPQGYATPKGPEESKRPTGTWPVLPDTVLTLGEHGYADWLADAAAAALWALGLDGVEADRFGFFGTSQGGGTALLLASIFRDRGVRAVAADVPFLTDFPLGRTLNEPGAYGTAFGPLEHIESERPDDVPAVWKAIGTIDTISHAHRLTMPVLLTAGAEDATCPPPTIRSLFDRLPGTRSYSELAGQGHAYTTPFIHLARAWFRLYV
jgi:cephalosporin-C deacetylase-like acetyl esterase